MTEVSEKTRNKILCLHREKYRIVQAFKYCGTMIFFVTFVMFMMPLGSRGESKWVLAVGMCFLLLGRVLSYIVGNWYDCKIKRVEEKDLNTSWQ